jgi:two-component system chemotaxis response regulator CheY
MRTGLVVDDSGVIRMVARRLLEAMGYAVEEAADGQQALAACTERMPDLVLLDWEMPGMAGIDVLKALRAMPGGDAPKVVFCATLTDATRIGEAIAAGADEYVMKPFDGAILGSKLALLGALGGTEAPSLA